MFPNKISIPSHGEDSSERSRRTMVLFPRPIIPGFLAMLGVAFSVGAVCGISPSIRSAVGTERTASPVVVYVVRHAEKAETGGPPNDLPLTERGKQRAAALAKAVQVSSLVAVYSTPFQRTRDTVAPAAKAAGLSVEEIPAADLRGLIDRIWSHKEGHVLVAGHSNTVPDILRELGVGAEIVIGEADFGDLFIVTIPQQGKATLEHRRFGDVEAPSPANPPIEACLSDIPCDRRCSLR